jgi:hypothetical protein
MGFSFIVTRRELLGNVKVVYGTFANTDNSTGGNIETNLRTLENFIIQPIKSTVVSDVAVVNGTLATAGGKQIIELTPTQGIVTIVTIANLVGFWTAFGQ